MFIDRGLWPQLCNKASYCLHPVLAQQQHQQVSRVLELEEVWPLRPGVVGEGSWGLPAGAKLQVSVSEWLQHSPGVPGMLQFVVLIPALGLIKVVVIWSAHPPHLGFPTWLICCRGH